MLLVLLLLGLGWVSPFLEGKKFFFGLFESISFSLFELCKFCKVGQNLTQTLKILCHILVLHL